ncbi:flavodoxin domain-containing protein [Thermomonospora cellulosilytica]|uniref:Menaquinone-dependent protoporphyrinogen oxidase n=1 Tax=Thermomonospora cellulosilytica TaxID=1411118 RepID=A0A7W3MVR6_9ACTN|nr:flavodoxin domain-containing protein [Thermomonospora cellulosilytica]MBA9002786.1 menaquinone-dependent protoporphyrinogen oxidase [Thermomonospora cellulosilytica]
MTTRVLVAYGSKRGSTAEIAEWIADALRQEGIDADVADAGRVKDVTGYDAVILGGALYAGRWHRAARRFARRNAGELIHLPVWAFSSGPLDHTAEEGVIEPPPSLTRIMSRIGAQSHATFGGRLDPEVHGMIASAVAKKQGGDYRDREQVRAWAREIARELAAIGV